MARPQEFDTNDVLHKAMTVFWHKGYEATSLSDLLDATGLSKSSLYGSFGSKRDLFLSAFDAYRNARAREMKYLLSQGSAREAISIFFKSLFSELNGTSGGRGCMSINQAVELAYHDADVRSRVLDDLKSIEAGLHQAIKKGQVEGSILSKEDPHSLAKLLTISFPGLQVMARAGYESSELETAVNVVLKKLDG